MAEHFSTTLTVGTTIMSDVPLLTPENPLAEPILRAIQRGQLLMQRCDRCRSYQYPPRPVCRRCAAFELSYQPVSGAGTIVEVSNEIEINDPFSESDSAFLLALIELAEDDRVVIPSKLVGVSTPTDAPPGTAVLASFEPTAAGERRLVFRTADSKA